MRRTRSTVTAATALAVAAVTGVSASVALATGNEGPAVQEFSVARESIGPDPRSMSTHDRPAHVTRPKTGERGIGPGPEVLDPPRRVVVPDLGVNAQVVPTGVTQRGDAQIPRDGDVIGWYEYGAAPGELRGSSVLIGHRDTQAEGPGALFDLDQLRPGASVRVSQGKRTVAYRVVQLRSIDKAGLPDALFRRGGPHQLVLITCGGPYLPDAGGYQENLFAIAVPKER